MIIPPTTKELIDKYKGLNESNEKLIQDLNNLNKESKEENVKEETREAVMTQMQALLNESFDERKGFGGIVQESDDPSAQNVQETEITENVQNFLNEHGQNLKGKMYSLMKEPASIAADDMAAWTEEVYPLIQALSSDAVKAAMQEKGSGYELADRCDDAFKLAKNWIDRFQPVNGNENVNVKEAYEFVSVP